MGRRKPCVACSDRPKAPGNPRYCIECVLRRAPVEARVRAAVDRLAMIPAELRVGRIPERDWPPDRRWCSGCQTFVLLVDVSDGQSRCKACVSNAAHGYRVQRVYGITKEEYDRLYEAQDGRCWLCGRKSESRRMAVDHDHQNGLVRGLLCPEPDWGCNYKVVPRFDEADDPVARAERLVDYLRDPPAVRIIGRRYAPIE